jgi:hypothetical protein
MGPTEIKGKDWIEQKIIDQYSTSDFITNEYYKISDQDGSVLLASGTGIQSHDYTITAADLTKTNLKFKAIIYTRI